MTRPFPVDPVLTAIAIAYRNKRMIADDILPRVPVAKSSFRYRKYALQDGFTIPNTLVGRTSKPNQIEFGFTEVPGMTQNYALDDPIPNDDIMDAPEGFNPVMHATEQLTNIITLHREIRVAKKVFNRDSYKGENVSTPATHVQWNDPDSNPIDAILEALDTMIMRPNIAILGRTVWTKLRQHSKIVHAIAPAAKEVGVASLAAVADLLELDAIYVGEAWLNTANRGQDANMARAWGNHAAFIYRDSLATASSGVTFGFTAQWGDRFSGKIEDPDLGGRGGVRVRVGESVDEVICADDLGFFFEDAIAA